jgi:hypothetical protein
MITTIMISESGVPTHDIGDHDDIPTLISVNLAISPGARPPPAAANHDRRRVPAWQSSDIGVHLETPESLDMVYNL